MSSDYLIQVNTILGIKVRTTIQYWQKITQFKHPNMTEREAEVIAVLENPTEIRKSKKDPSVLLYYRGTGDYHVCVVVKVLNGDGFIITAYITENIKEGDRIWPK